MTNWPNIQEQKNFEEKLFDKPKRENYLNSSATEDEVDSAIKTDSNDWTDNFKSAEFKTVRCVIKRDFEETFKKFDRGDGFIASQDCVRSKLQEPTISQSVVDNVRLQNHLKWKKQKEEEYLQRKEAEKAAALKKKEEEIKMEKIKKQKEKERAEKIREWQEQKAREKERKKGEKIVLRVLEEELKETTPVIDKEKLIENWVKLKDKQKQMEAEKKAEILKREEESKALRQNLAALSYRKWKERAKAKMILLPKNGYQIFGPKPAPVVKEDWNHDFGNSSPRQEIIGLRNSKSNAATSLTFRSEMKELENLSKDILSHGDPKCRSPSLCRLKNIKSGLDLSAANDNGMPLKELQPGTIGSKKNCKSKIGFPEHLMQNFLPASSQMNLLVSKYLDGIHSDKLADNISPEFYLPLKQCKQNQCVPPASNNKDSKHLGEPLNVNNVPVKKKIDLYINTPIVGAAEVDSRTKFQKKPIQKLVAKTMGNVKVSGKVAEPKEKILSKKSSTLVNKKSQVFGTSNSSVKPTNKTVDVAKVAKKIIQAQSSASKKSKICRKSRSCDKPLKKTSKERIRSKRCSSSKSLTKIEEDVKRTEKKLTVSGRKKKPTKMSNSRSADGTKKRDDNLREIEAKAKRKLKKKSSTLSKSVINTDSPYSGVKSGSKNLDKGKIGQRKTFKDGETKVDCTGRCRKSSTTKIS